MVNVSSSREQVEVTLFLKVSGKTKCYYNFCLGIGRAVVKRLHSYGAIVIATSRNPENLKTLKVECPRIETIVADLQNWEETRSAFDKLEPVDCLLNNAGLGAVKSLMTSTLEEFNQFVNFDFMYIYC